MQAPLSTIQEALSNRLVLALTRAFDAMGGVVRIDPRGENLIRAAGTELCPGAGPDAGSDSSPIVEVQGLANLVHEMVHALNHGRLDDDSGFDYARIPLRFEQLADRIALWDELCACALSCDYGSIPWKYDHQCAKTAFEASRASFRRTPDPRSSAHADPAQTNADSAVQACPSADAWFSEQVDILPVFYGLEHRPAEFVALVKSTIVDHAHELEDFETHTRARFRELVAHYGERGLAARLPAPTGVAERWRHYCQLLGDPGHEA